MDERVIGDLSPGPDDLAWFEATARGALLLRHCDACGELHFPPRPICPHCFSDRTGFVQACGRGVIYSFSILRRVAAPYCIGYVTLEEGPTLLSNIVGCEFEKIAIGMPVRVVFRSSANGHAVPMFTPG